MVTHSTTQSKRARAGLSHPVCSPVEYCEAQQPAVSGQSSPEVHTAGPMALGSHNGMGTAVTLGLLALAVMAPLDWDHCAHVHDADLVQGMWDLTWG